MPNLNEEGESRKWRFETRKTKIESRGRKENEIQKQTSYYSMKLNQRMKI